MKAIATVAIAATILLGTSGETNTPVETATRCALESVAAIKNAKGSDYMAISESELRGDGLRSDDFETSEDYFAYLEKVSAEEAEREEAAKAQAEADARFWARYEAADAETRKKLESVITPTPISEPAMVWDLATGEYVPLKNADTPVGPFEPDPETDIPEFLGQQIAR